MARSRRLFIAMRLVFAMGVMVLFLAFTVEVHAKRPVSVSEGSVPPTWDRTLPANDGEADGCNSSRFICVLPDATFPNGGAVRDNETGLVWDRSPSSTQRTWVDAIRTCWQHEIGGRIGFHLPMIEQLASLVDTTVAAPGPTLPPGHPFLNVQSGSLFGDAYWSVTTDVRTFAEQAWEVRFTDGTTGDSNRGSPRFFWCVRGGQAFDGQDNVAAISSTHP